MTREDLLAELRGTYAGVRGDEFDLDTSGALALIAEYEAGIRAEALEEVYRIVRQVEDNVAQGKHCCAQGAGPKATALGVAECLSQKIRALKLEHARLASRLEHAEQRAKELRNSYSRVVGECNAALAERDEALARAKAAEERRDYAEAYLQDSTTSGGAVIAERDALRAERDELAKKLATAEQAADEADEELGALRDTITDSLPVYVLGDDDAEANEHETVEYAGDELKRLAARVEKLEKALRPFEYAYTRYMTYQSQQPQAYVWVDHFEAAADCFEDKSNGGLADITGAALSEARGGEAIKPCACGHDDVKHDDTGSCVRCSCDRFDAAISEASGEKCKACGVTEPVYIDRGDGSDDVDVCHGCSERIDATEKDEKP